MDAAAIDRVFMALADPTRRGIVEILAVEGRQRISDLAARFASTRQAVTKHLDVLCAAGVVSTERRGRERIATLERDGCDPARTWLVRYDGYWDRKLLDLKALIEEGEPDGQG